MNWVIDCSFAAALFVPDDASQKVQSFFAGLNPDDSIWVPSLWWYELTNVLTMAERRKLIQHKDALKIMFLYDQFNLFSDNTQILYLCSRIYELAKTYKLTVYDATYLELSIRKNAKLASLDAQLLNAAEKSGIEILRFID